MRGMALLAAVAALGTPTDQVLVRRLQDDWGSATNYPTDAPLRLNLPAHVQRRPVHPGRGTPSRRSLRLRGRSRGLRRARKAARRG